MSQFTTDQHFELLLHGSKNNNSNFSPNLVAITVNMSSFLLTEEADCYSSSRDPSTPILSTWAMVFVSALFVATSVVVVLANVAVISIHFCAAGGRGSGRARLNITRYLCYLGVADLIKGLNTVPIFINLIKQKWQLFGVFCPLTQFGTLFAEFHIAVILSVIGIERYIVLWKPLSVQLRTQQIGHCVIISTFFLGALYANIPTQYITMQEVKYTGGRVARCISSLPYKRAFLVVHALFTGILPLLILLATCLGIARVVGQRKMPTDTDGEIGVTVDEKRKLYRRILSILIWLIVSFSLCNCPLKVFQLLTVFELLPSKCIARNFYLIEYTALAVNWLATMNSLLQPILYTFCSDSVRKSAKFSNRFQKVLHRFSSDNYNGNAQTAA